MIINHVTDARAIGFLAKISNFEKKIPVYVNWNIYTISLFHKVVDT